MNATAVVAHEPYWRRFFSQHPDEYKEVWSGGRFTLYSRAAYRPSYFLNGEGVLINEESNSVVLKLATPDAVLKFNYFPFLEAHSCERVEPFVAAPEVTLVKLVNCPVGEPIKLHSKSPLWRLLHG